MISEELREKIHESVAEMSGAMTDLGKEPMEYPMVEEKKDMKYYPSLYLDADTVHGEVGEEVSFVGVGKILSMHKSEHQNEVCIEVQKIALTDSE